MSIRLNLKQLREQLPELIDSAARGDDVYLIERDGEPLVVLVSIREWRRRTVGKKLDALGPQYRITKAQQKRSEELLARKEEGLLTKDERRELNKLLRISDEVMLRRAQGLKQI